MARQFGHVIFDLDGTLVDSKDDLTGAVNSTLSLLGLRTQAPEQLCQYIGQGARLLVKRALGEENASRLDEAVDLFLRHYRDHLLDQTVPYEGVPELLDRLQASRVTMTLLTNKPWELTAPIVRGLAIDRYFAAIVAGDTLPTRKPDPAGAWWLCRRVEATRSRTLMVGDSSTDVETARSAVVASCGVTWGFNGRRVMNSQPDYLIDRPGELVAVVLGS